MDWFASGIKNELIYKLASFDLETEYGELPVKRGTITDNYNADCKSALTVEIDGEQMPTNRLLRVYLRSSLDGESITDELGTYYFERNQALAYSRGRYYGTVALQSALYALNTNHRGAARSVKKGMNIKTYFEEIVEAGRCVPLFSDNLNDEKNLGKNHVWEYGESVLKECNFLANSISGIIEPDTHGRVCLNKYLRPSKRAQTWTLDERNTIGEITIGTPDMVNRVFVKHEANNRVIVGGAVLDAGHEFSRRNIGHYISEAGTVTELEPATKAAANDEAAERLAAAADTARTFQVVTLWNPTMTTGSRGTLMLAGEPIDATIEQRQITLDRTMLMTLTLKEITG